VLETALNEEMTEHLGYEKHDPPGAGTGNIRTGTRAKTVLTDSTGQVEIDVPRDRAVTFERHCHVNAMSQRHKQFGRE
jgi:putative transposase